MLDLMAAVKFSNLSYISDELLDKSIDFVSENPKSFETKLKGIDKQHVAFYQHLANPSLIYLTIKNDNQIIGEEEYRLMLQEANETFAEFPLTRSIETTTPDVTFTYTGESESRGQILYDIAFSKYLNDSKEDIVIESDMFPKAKKFLKSLQNFNDEKTNLLVNVYKFISFCQSGFFEYFDKARMIKLDQEDLSNPLDADQAKISRILSGRHFNIINKKKDFVNVYIGTLMPNNKQIQRFYTSGALNRVFLEEMKHKIVYTDMGLAGKVNAERCFVNKLRLESGVPNHRVRGREYCLDKNKLYTIEY